MKTSLTKLKSSFIVLITLGSFPLWAKPVAQVIELKGQVFAVTPDGKTTALKVNQHLEEKTDVMVEEGGSVTLNDYYDATYHLIGGSHIKFYNKSVQLKRGKTWVQSLNARHPLALTTANGNVDFLKGEFITTFDQPTSRSQVLVVNGEVEVSNVLDKNLKYTVSAGSFTLVDPDVENGVPRSPTKVGVASLNTALAEFKQLPQTLKSDTGSRTIASASEESKKGEIIFISSNRLPASVQGSALSYYKNKTKKVSSAPVPIRFYGVTQASVPSGPTLRMPASTPRANAKTLGIDQEFADSLKRKTVEQPKHPKELETLIHDLKSF